MISYIVSHPNFAEPSLQDEKSFLSLRLARKYLTQVLSTCVERKMDSEDNSGRISISHNGIKVIILDEFGNPKDIGGNIR